MRVSIIVPVFKPGPHANYFLASHRKALNKIPNDITVEYQIVSNGNTEQDNLLIGELIKELGDFAPAFYHEECVKSSYAARNHGVRYADGEYLLFIDFDVIVPEDFFEKLKFVIRLGGGGQFYGAGFIDYISKDKIDIWGKLEEIYFLRQDAYIASGRGATACCFLNRELFLARGGFRVAESGEDLRFTGELKASGVNFVYHNDFRVFHPYLKNKTEFFNKLRRVCRGIATQDTSRYGTIIKLLLGLLLFVPLFKGVYRIYLRGFGFNAFFLLPLFVFVNTYQRFYLICLLKKK